MGRNTCEMNLNIRVNGQQDEQDSFVNGYDVGDVKRLESDEKSNLDDGDESSDEIPHNDDEAMEMEPSDCANKSPSPPCPMDVPMDTSKDGKAVETKNTFALLIEAARIINPKQFEIPNEYISSVPLPGMSKKSVTNEKSKKKLPHELDNGLVPLPVKICFLCTRSCRKAPLIQCDFCPLLFHADCLDPPLTALPAGRWMCPNHGRSC